MNFLTLHYKQTKKKGLVSYLDYFSTVMLKTSYSSEMSVEFRR
jgi:hypothetical protein